jgi:hypothetical protein
VNNVGLVLGGECKKKNQVADLFKVKGQLHELAAHQQIVK